MRILQMPARDSGAASTGAQSVVLPVVWATEGSLAKVVELIHTETKPHAEVLSPGLTPAADAAERERSAPVFRVVLAPQTAFYRRYTEAMLRRYGVLSLESGRVPSLLGRELFRGKVTNYKVQAFDDVVIFVHDVEQCIKTLTPDQQHLILRIGVQEYTFAETASMLRLSLRSTERRYLNALDELTGIFLQKRLLEKIAVNSCQEGGGSTKLVSHTPEST